ncbi:MAG: helix-turn-helix domain-containing protein [Leptospiraceae bacterium]|nr:helix-turn-helix domain-containing protein [Leptospiraceae bacterium]
MKKEDYNQLFDHLGLSQRAFAKKYNVAQSTISDIVNGKIKSLPVDIIYKVHQDHGISLKWLITGEGEMLQVQGNESLSKEESLLIEEIRKDPKLISLIKSFIEALKKNL